MMSRFPKLTETFILDEILEFERQGATVELFPLWRERTEVMHPDAKALVSRAHFAPTLSLPIVRDTLRCMIQRPGMFLRTLGTLVRANRHSLRFLTAAIAIFPKSCSFAVQMRELGVRHVHAHFASHPAAAAFIIGRMADIPWSFTAHGSDLHREQSMLQEKVSEAAFVVAISEYNKAFILQSVGPIDPERIRVIHCGVALDQFVRAEADAHELAIVCIGTLHEVKGQAVLLRACAELRDAGLSFRCHFIGDGPDRVALEQLAASLSLSDQVVFHGACERERVRLLLATMSVAVAPSVPTTDGRREGIPVALMEGAACGLPLVASRLSGIPELVRDGETGYLAEPGDASGIARALCRIAHAPDRGRGLGERARALLEREFSLQHNVAQLQRLMLYEPGS